MVGALPIVPGRVVEAGLVDHWLRDMGQQAKRDNKEVRKNARTTLCFRGFEDMVRQSEMVLGPDRFPWRP